MVLDFPKKKTSLVCQKDCATETKTFNKSLPMRQRGQSPYCTLSTIFMSIMNKTTEVHSLKQLVPLNTSQPVLFTYAGSLSIDQNECPSSGYQAATKRISNLFKLIIMNSSLKRKSHKAGLHLILSVTITICSNDAYQPQALESCPTVCLNECGRKTKQINPK